MINSQMASGVIRLKGRELLAKSGKTRYRIVKNGAASRPTVDRYLATPEELKEFDARVLYGILIDGLGLTIEEVEDMRFGDVFGLIPDEQE